MRSQTETNPERQYWLPMSADATELLLCFNPSAGARERSTQVAAIQAELTRSGYSVRRAASGPEAGDLATKGLQSRRLRAVIACGGDGTARFLRKHVPFEVALLPLPMGTECLLSRYLEQSALPDDVRQTIDRGVIVNLDLGRIKHGPGNVDYFLMMISAGFDAAVVRQLHAKRRGHISRLSYLQPILQTIRSYEYPEMQLYCDEAAGSVHGPVRCRWLFGSNLPLYALGWQFTPHASGLDGQFDVCTFQGGSLLDGARYLWHVVRRTHLHLPDAEVTRGRRLRIESNESCEVPFQLDGDFVGMLPVELEVLPGALRLLVLPQVAAKLGFAAPEIMTTPL
jgi:diacylglycerol kinase (ATP)